MKLKEEIEYFEDNMLDGDKLNDCGGCMISATECFKYCYERLEKQREELDEEWTNAVMYNVDSETWDRIRNAKHTLSKPKLKQ